MHVVKVDILYYNSFNIKNKVGEMKDYEICYYNDKNMSNDEKHVHSYYEVYFLSEDNASVFIQNKLYKLWQGDVVILPPGTLHRVIHREESET